MENKNNIYLVTGASGFIGRHLVDELSSKDCQLRCMVTSNRYKNLWSYPNVTAVVGNLLDKQSLEGALSGVSVCIHLASIINSKDKAEFQRVNVEGIVNLIEASERNNIQKFIYISTVEVQSNPSSLYGKTKLAAEEKLKRSQLNYTILRPSVVYGEHDNKNIATLIDLIEHSPIIPIIGNGRYRRQPIYVRDLIDAITKCAEMDYTNSKVYNIAGPSYLSMNEIVKIIIKVLDKKRLIIHVPIALIKMLYVLFGRISSLCAAHAQQILSIADDKILDISSSHRELCFNPVEFESGLRIMLRKSDK